MNKKTKKTKAKTIDEIKLDFGWEFFAAVALVIALMIFIIVGMAHLVANGFLTR